MNLSLNVSLLTIALITSNPILATAQDTALNSHAGNAHPNHDHADVISILRSDCQINNENAGKKSYAGSTCAPPLNVIVT